MSKKTFEELNEELNPSNDPEVAQVLKDSTLIRAKSDELLAKYFPTLNAQNISERAGMFNISFGGTRTTMMAALIWVGVRLATLPLEKANLFKFLEELYDYSVPLESSAKLKAAYTEGQALVDAQKKEKADKPFMAKGPDSVN